VRIEEGRDTEGGKNTGCQGVVSVEDGSMLGRTGEGGGSVEAGPVHPQEDGSHH